MKSDAQLARKSQFDRQHDGDTTTTTARHENDRLRADRAGLVRSCRTRYIRSHPRTRPRGRHVIPKYTDQITRLEIEVKFLSLS